MTDSSRCCMQGMRRTQSLNGFRDAGAAPWQRYSDWRRENPGASRAESRAFIERALSEGRAEGRAAAAAY